MHILGVYIHVSARYEVSMSNAVTGTAVHRWQHQWQWWWWHQRWWQWHMMDKSWLHRLLGMYAKWAKNSGLITKVNRNKKDASATVHGSADSWLDSNFRYFSLRFYLSQLYFYLLKRFILMTCLYVKVREIRKNYSDHQHWNLQRS